MFLHQRHSWIAVIVCAMAGHTGLADETFEATPIGDVPSGWFVTTTGTQTGSVWKVREDNTAPSGKKVLTQASPSGPSGLFNLCVSTEPVFADVDFSAALKPLDGKIDQGGGLVWHFQDHKNYYVVRWNPLEGDLRLFSVIDGKRSQLSDPVRVDAKVGEWHTLRVLQCGNEISCFFDGTQYFDVTDDSLPRAGRFGFWTKADAVTAFTAPAIASLSAEPGLPRVLAVNTQDASVSLVDLTTRKELARHRVGVRPYGIAVSRDGKTVAVGVEDEECVKFFSCPDFKLLGTTPIGRMFNDHIMLSQDGRSILVANFYSDDVVVIDIETRKEMGRIRGCSAPHVVKYGPLKQHAFVTCKKITGIAVIDPAHQQLVKFHPLNVNPRSLTFSPDESKAYFASFWVNGFFELDMASGKVTRLFSFAPSPENSSEQEVTYHGVESIGNNIVLAANEGRSFVDAVDVSAGTLLDRLTTVNRPCCIERVPGPAGGPVRVLISNLSDGTLQLVDVEPSGKMRDAGRVTVGQAPKRVAFLP